MSTSGVTNSKPDFLNTARQYLADGVLTAATGYMAGYTAGHFLPTNGLSPHQTGLVYAIFSSIASFSHVGIVKASSHLFSAISGTPAKNFKNTMVLQIFSALAAFQVGRTALNYISPEYSLNISHVPLPIATYIAVALAASTLQNAARNTQKEPPKQEIEITTVNQTIEVTA